MVLGAVDLDGLDVYTMVDHSPFDPTIKRTESVSEAGIRKRCRQAAGWMDGRAVTSLWQAEGAGSLWATME
jgi:hypothetical protein